MERLGSCSLTAVAEYLVVVSFCDGTAECVYIFVVIVEIAGICLSYCP